MQITSWFLACLLLGQPGQPSQHDAQDKAPLVPVDPDRWRQAPGHRSGGQPKTESAEALLRDLTLPGPGASAEPLAGRPVTLLEILAAAPPRNGRIQATLAYWKLSAAMADVEIAREELRRLAQYLPAEDDNRSPVDPRLESRRAAATAQVDEAQLALAAAQQELAQITGQPAGEALPLAADLPHVGAYETQFRLIYPSGAPPLAHWAHHSLPLRHRVITARALAVEAALDAVEGAWDRFQAGDLELAIALDTIAQLGRQRQQFVAAVRDYNQQIAEYALSLAPEGMGAAGLAAMLIKPSTTSPAGAAGSPAPADQPGGIERTDYQEPIEDRQHQPDGEPTDQTPMNDDAQSAPPSDADGKAAEPADNDKPDEPAAPGRGSIEQGESRQPRQSRLLIGPQAARRTARKPDDAESDVAAAVGLYAGLVDLPPARRAHQLSSLLHWDQGLPEADRSLVELDESLASVPAGGRRTLIETFWQARQQAALYQVVDQYAQQFSALTPVALRMRGEPGGPEAMLRLRAAQLAAEADRAQAHLLLLAAQYGLTMAVGRPLDAPWLLAATTPHAGRYRLKLQEQPEPIAHSPQVGRIAEAVATLAALLTERSLAVVSADSARAIATAEYEAGQVAVDEPLAAIRQQVQQTEAFLAAQTDYNLAIADYVLSVLPVEAPASTLVGALVVRKPAGPGQP